MTAFWTLRPEFLPTYAKLGKLENAREDLPLSHLRRGTLVGVDLGAKARFVRSTLSYGFGPSGKKTPAGAVPVDLFATKQAGCLVASPRLAETLASLDSALRLVRVKLVDIKGVDHGFVLTGPLVDALDLRASGAKVESFGGVPSEITRAKQLVLSPSKVPADRRVFRVPLVDDVWFVRDDARAALATFVGVELGDPAAKYKD